MLTSFLPSTQNENQKQHRNETCSENNLQFNNHQALHPSVQGTHHSHPLPGSREYPSWNVIKGEGFLPEYQNDLIGILKQFCMWLVENEELTLSEKKVKAIKQPQKCPTKKASDLLTHDEIQALMAVCQTSRDRAS